MAGLHLQRKYGVKFIFDMRGFWADERVDGKIWNLSNPIFNTIYKYFKKKEKAFLEEADYIISLTEHARDVIHTWASVQGNPVFMRRVNGWLTIFWIIMIPVSVMTGWIQSVAYISVTLGTLRKAHSEILASPILMATSVRDWSSASLILGS